MGHRGPGPLLIFKQPFLAKSTPSSPSRSFFRAFGATTLSFSSHLGFLMLFLVWDFLANFKGWIELQTNKPLEIHYEIIASILRPSSSTALFFKSNFKVALYKKILVPERSHMNQSMSPCRFTFASFLGGHDAPSKLGRFLAVGF